MANGKILDKVKSAEPIKKGEKPNHKPINKGKSKPANIKINKSKD